MTVVEEVTWSCVHCTQDFTHEAEQPMASSSGETCESCYEDLRSCNWCDESFHVDDMSYVDIGDYFMCPQHAHMILQCNGCSITLTSDDDHGNGCGLVLCDSCADYYSCCDSCGDVVHNDYMHYVDRSDEHHCDGCYVENDYVHSYDYTPDFRVFGRSRAGQETATTFGVELEVEYREADWQQANTRLQELWTDKDVTFLKSDGSLSSGVEAVSHPMTLAYAKENINREALASLSEYGVRSWKTSTCGIHIHIGRDTFLNHSHLARFMILFTRSKEQIVKLAGRETSQWASFELNYNESMVKQAFGKQHPDTRYRAINLTNRNTVEVRVFRGSLNGDTIIAHMELLAAMIEYTREQRNIVGMSVSLTWTQFRGWLFLNRQQYPLANTRCTARVDRRI